MQDVLNKLGEAHDEIQKIDKESREKLAEVLLREARSFKKEKELNEKESMLNEREAAVSKIESVVALKQEATDLMDKAQKLNESVIEAQKQLNADTKAANDKLVDLRETARREQENVDRQKKEIEEEVGRRVQQCLINMGIKKA